MNRRLSAIALVFLAPCLANGQEQPVKTAKPTQELVRLGYYVGTWKGNGETKGGPFGAAGKLSSKMTCDWFAGGYQVVCRGDETGPTGKRAFLDILSYDDKTKTYSEYSVSSLGDTEYDQGGTITGNEVRYVITQPAPGGKSLKIRYTEMRLSPSRMSYRTEASLGGAPWSEIAEGTISKDK